MKNKILNNTINFINNYYHYDNIKLLELKYGLETLYISITKLFVTILISIPLKTYKEVLLLILFYGLLRMVMFGAHGKNSIQCWFMTLIIFNLFAFLIKNTNISKLLMLLCFIVFIVLIYKYSPGSTEKRKIKKRKKLLNSLSILFSLIYMFIITFFANNYYSNILFYSLLLSVIFILPITYRIMGVKYTN